MKDTAAGNIDLFDAGQETDNNNDIEIEAALEAEWSEKHLRELRETKTSARAVCGMHEETLVDEDEKIFSSSTFQVRYE